MIIMAFKGSELELQAECHVRIEVLLQLLVREVDAKLPYSHMKTSWRPTQIIQVSPNSSSYEHAWARSGSGSSKEFQSNTSNP